MQKKVVRHLNEQTIQKIVTESVKKILKEMDMNGMDQMQEGDDMEEGWLKDKWNQTKSAASSLRGLGSNGVKQTVNNMKSNWTNQGELNGLSGLRQQLEKFVDDGQINPQTTVAQLIGGKYNNNKFGKLTGKENSRKSQISKRGGKSYEE